MSEFWVIALMLDYQVLNVLHSVRVKVYVRLLSHDSIALRYSETLCQIIES